MRYIPHTKDDVRRMLEAVGVATVEDLFASIPKKLQLDQALDLPEPLDESALCALMRKLSTANTGSGDRMAQFLGAGAYAHHVPAAVDMLLQRGEFFTAYTPYQAEVSQGTLQAIFEYQSMMASLLGTELVNASMYDGASATAEALLMALRVARKRKRLLLARSLHPEVAETCNSYLSEHNEGTETIPFGPQGTTDLDALKKTLDEGVAAVVVQSPNALGCIEPLAQIAEMAHAAGALLIAVVLEPVSLGMLEAPGHQGADIVTGEGSAFGTGLNYGGPGLGLFGAAEKQVWQMPGRLVGQTTDDRGQTGYVLTMASREQHIRRGRATSNICSNEGLCMLAAVIHLSLLGKQGLTELARINAANAQATAERLVQINGVEMAFAAPYFNEFVLKVPGGVDAALKRLDQAGIIGGLALKRFYPELDDHLLLCVTELNDAEQVERYAEALTV